MASFARWSLGTALLLCACTSSRYSVETERERPRHVAEYLREERADYDDKDLGALLDQIDLRASVELAKAEMRRNRP